MITTVNNFSCEKIMKYSYWTRFSANFLIHYSDCKFHRNPLAISGNKLKTESMFEIYYY